MEDYTCGGLVGYNTPASTEPLNQPARAETSGADDKGVTIIVANDELI